MSALEGPTKGAGPGPSTLRHARRVLLLQYQARIPPRSEAFVWPSHAILLCIQDKLDRDLFRNPRFEASIRYRTLFLRELCARLDAAVQEECKELRAQGVDEIEYPEVDAALLETYIGVMATRCSGTSVVAAGSSPDADFTTHSWPVSATSMLATGGDDEDVDLLKNHLSVTIREEGAAISKGTTGLRAWEAGLRLAAHLISDFCEITSPGTRILELGSGTGIVGAVCAIQQMSSSNRDVHTFMTDMPGQVSARLRDTLHLNGLDAASDIVEIKELDWLELVAERQQSQQRDDLPTISFITEARPTLILAADVVYDPDLIEPLVETIRACLQAGTEACKALVASTIRNPETYGLFKASLESFGLKGKVVELQRPKVTAHDLLALPVFPSAHDPTLNGMVELLCITLG